MSLKSDAIAGFKWNSFFIGFNVVVNLTQNVLLARFLTSEEYGTMSLVHIVLSFGLLAADLGLNKAIIQKQNVTTKELSTLYWITALVGLSIYLVVFVSCGAFARFYETPALADYIPIAALSFVIGPLGTQFSVLLEKELKFKTLALIGFAGTLVQFVSAVTLAFLGYGVWSLVWSHLIFVSIVCLFNIFFGLKIYVPSLRFRPKEVSAYFSFGVYQLMDRLFNFFSGNLDKVIIGRVLGTEALGVYSYAWNLIIQPIIKLNPVITRVAFPVFSKIQNEPETLNRYYLRAMELIILINLPLYLGMAVMSEELVEVLYGSKWADVALPLAILSAAGVMKALGNPGGSVVLAKGRADFAFGWNVLLTLSVGALVMLFLWRESTLESVSWAQVAAAYGVGWIWHVIIAKVGNIDYRALSKILLQYLGFVGVMAAFVLLSKQITYNSSLLGLIIPTLVGVVIYTFCIYIWKRDLILPFLNRKN